MGVYSGILLEKFSDDRVSNQTYCDVTLNVAGKKFHCHKFLLGAVSEYFHILFKSKFKDSCSDEITVSTPFGSTAGVFEQFIQYIYSEEISLNSANVLDVLFTANYFKVDQLEKHCVHYLMENISPENYFDIYRSANQLNILKLQKKCSDQYLKQSVNIDHSLLSPQEMMHLIEAHYKLMSSKHLFQVMSAWVKVAEDDPKRRDCFFALIKYVDFKLMNSDFLTNHVLSERIIANHDSLANELKELNKSKHMLMIAVSFIHRGPVLEDNMRLTLKYCSQSKLSVSSEPELFLELGSASKVYAFIAVSTKSYIYLISFSVEETGKENARIFTYNIESGVWTSQKMCMENCYSRACIIQDKLYILPEQCGDTFQVYTGANAGVLKYSETDVESLPDLKTTNRIDFEIVSKGFELFILGGNSNLTDQPAPNEVLNTLTSEQYCISDFMYPKVELSAFLSIDHENIIAYGYENEHKRAADAKIESFSFTTMQWTVVIQLPSINRFESSSIEPLLWIPDKCSICMFDGVLHAFGYDAIENRFIMKYFDAETSEWLVLSDFTMNSIPTNTKRLFLTFHSTV